MTKEIGKYAGQLIAAAMADDSIVKATKYINEKFVIKATRRRYGKARKVERKNGLAQFNVTIGGPNYLERRAIKQFKAAGEPFPVKKITLKRV